MHHDPFDGVQTRKTQGNTSLKRLTICLERKEGVSGFVRMIECCINTDHSYLALFRMKYLSP